STLGERSHFHESVIYLDYAHQYYVLARMNNHMSEELAQRLEFHIDPNDAQSGHSFLEDKNGNGIFCDKVNCKICDATRNGAVTEANSVGAEKRN
ncbi:MAG: hypothetical protein Q7T18_00355, partial [Sedimentisphaerales bacterium]|nr:hypothetical protein [Sedimentisphaerales bacterium]